MKKIIRKVLPIVVVVALLVCCCIVPVSAGGRYLNTGEVNAADWSLWAGIHNGVDLQISDQGEYYEFTIPDLSVGDSVYFWVSMKTTQFTIYDTETLHGFVQFNAFSNAGGYELSRSKVILYDLDDVDNNLASPGWPAIGVSPEGSLPSQTLVNYQIGFDMSTNLSFDMLQLDFIYKKSRDLADTFRIYKTSFFQLYTGDLDSELLSEMVTEQQITNDYLEEITGDKYENPADGELGDAIGNNDELESEIADGTADGMEGAVGIFKSFELTDFKDGLLGWIAIFNVFVNNIGWLYGLLNISLALGLFSFLVGMASIVVSVHSRNSAAKEREWARYQRSIGRGRHKKE